MYHANNYGLNNHPEWWDGKTIHSNEQVYDGTYYYTLELFHKTKEEKEKFSGFIQILTN